VPWFKVNFIGAGPSAKSLRHLAEYFGDAALAAKAESLIEAEMAAVKEELARVRPRLEGKSVLMYVGGSRAHHYQDLFKELGMRVVSAGYEFAHRDDYEGRRVMPSIKVDADSRNIEELHVEKDEARYSPRRSDAQIAELKSKGLPMNDYEGMMSEMAEGSLVIDDISHYETEKLIELVKPTSCAPASKRSTWCRSTASRSSSCTTTISAALRRLPRRGHSTERSTGW